MIIVFLWPELNNMNKENMSLKYFAKDWICGVGLSYINDVIGISSDTTFFQIKESSLLY